jgi:actin-related protein
MSPRIFIDQIGHVLFRSFSVKSIFFFLSNAMPLYATGVDTGIMVDCGLQQAQILPIVRSRLCTEALEVNYSACGIKIEKVLNENLTADNKEFIRSGKPGDVSERGMPIFNFPKDVLEDVKVRSLVVM